MLRVFAIMALASLASFTPRETGLPRSPQETDEEQAAADLEKAEEHVREGRYDRGRSGYVKLAKKYPDTAAGRVASRRLQPNALLGWAYVMQNGPSSNRVDIVVTGDGYLMKKQDSLEKVAEDVLRVFERNQVFEEYLSYLNLLRANIVSEEDGVDGFGRDYSTALGAKVDGDSIQGQVTIDKDLVRHYLAEIPEHDDFAIVLVPQGVSGTGGGGVATIGGRNFKTVIHEWGHAFAELGDEYVDNTGPRGSTQNRINVANVEDPARVPWRHWLEAKVPGIGVYEGADGRVRGAWKPTASGCIMESGEFFCHVCREALVLRIHEFVDPIDGCAPEPLDPENENALEVADQPLEFEVVTLKPKKHILEARWWVLPESQAPPVTDPHLPERKKRGPLQAIQVKPDSVSKLNKKGIHRFKLATKDLEPGRYRVICRVKDTTELRGERFPWVLSDGFGLLESERTWTVKVGPKD